MERVWLALIPKKCVNLWHWKKQARFNIMIYKFEPLLKPTVWGGSKLTEFKHLPAAGEPMGESWEISAVKGMESVVAEGPEAGLTLPQLIERHGEALLGKRVAEQFGGVFPLLIKFIDARADLSVQVHPDDETAERLHGPGSMGKTEMWYVISAADDATLRAGLVEGSTKEKYLEVEGTAGLEDMLALYRVKPGDVFFLPAGRVHSIGAGCFIAEIQQTSDITYRIYDFGRPRQLHIAEAREAIDFDTILPDYRTAYDPADAVTPIVSCPYFTTRHCHATEPVAVEPTEGSFTVVMVLEGGATVDGVDAPAGTTLLLSADHGRATVLPGNEGVRFLTAVC